MSDVFGDAFKELAAHDAEVSIDKTPTPTPVVTPPVAGDLPDPAAASTGVVEKTLVLDDDDGSTVPAGVTIETPEAKVAREATEAATAATAAEKAASDAAAAAAAVADKPGTVTMDDAALERLAKLMRPDPAPTPAAPAPRFNEEEQAIVTAFEKDFPDVARAQEIIRAAEYKEIVNYVFAQIAPRLNAVEAAAGQVVGDTHLDRLQVAIPDYDTVVPEVVKWIDQQPDYIKATFQAVAQKGTVAQVVDMVNRYRTSVGKPLEPAAGETAEEVAAREAAATAAAAEAARKTPTKVAAALAPVSSKRTGQSTGVISADDFDGAFGAFAKLVDA